MKREKLIFRLQDVFTNFVYEFLFSITAVYTLSTVHNLSSKRREKKPMWNVMRSALQGLVLQLKGNSCSLLVFCFETGPNPDPHCWINAWHFLRSAHPTGQNHLSIFFLEEWRSAFTAGWYNTGVTVWQEIWCRFQAAFSNYSSALGWDKALMY